MPNVSRSYDMYCPLEIMLWLSVMDGLQLSYQGNLSCTPLLYPLSPIQGNSLC
jgi:hypothetical protein